MAQTVKCILMGQKGGGSSAVKLNKISITKPPTKTSYLAGDTFNPAGMEVTASYLLGGQPLADVVISGYKITPQVLLDGMTEVTISYLEDGINYTVKQPITVVHKLQSIMITSQPTKTVYEYGDSFSSAGIGVSATYSDNTDSSIARENLTFSAPATFDSLGDKTITITYTENGISKSVTYSITVERKSIPKPTWKSNVVYSGSEFNVNSATYWNNYNATYMTIRGSYIATDAGNYVMIFTPTSNYRWSDKTTDSIETTWTIERATITNIPAQSGSLAYTGSSQTPSWSNYNSSQLTLGGTTSGTNVDSYSATFTPKDNYKWSDGSTTPKTITWTIEKATIAVPYQSSSLTYNGNAQSPSWTNYNSAQMTMSGDTSKTDAGTYTTTFTPTSNYKWTDGSITAKSVSWSIGKASDTLTLSKTSISLTTSTKSTTFTATRSGAGAVSASSSNTSVATVSVSGTTVTVTGVSNGSATITVSVAESANYNAPDSKTVSVSVQLNVSIPNIPSQSGTLTYSGSSQSPSWSNYDSTQLTLGGTTSGTNAGSYNATFTPKSGYQWSDGTTSAKTVSWSIGKMSLTVPAQSGSLTYTGSSQTPSWTNYNSNTMTIDGSTTGTNAGSYTATFTLKNTNNYQWSDGTTSIKSVTWQIKKATGSCSLSSTSASLTNSSKTKTFTVTRNASATVSASSSNTKVVTVGSISNASSSSNASFTITAVGNGSATITVTAAATTNYDSAYSTISVSVTGFSSSSSDGSVKIYINGDQSSTETLTGNLSTINITMRKIGGINNVSLSGGGSTSGQNVEVFCSAAGEDINIIIITTAGSYFGTVEAYNEGTLIYISGMATAVYVSEGSVDI